MPAAAPAISTVNALAARTGLSEPTVRRALTLGNVEAVSRGKYPTAAAEAAIRQHSDPMKIAGHALVGRGNVEAHQLGDGQAFATISSARRDNERLRNEKLQFDLDVKRGKYLPREAIMTAGADIVRRATFHFLAIGPRAAPRLVGMTDPAEIAAVLEEEARVSLAELAGLDLVAEILG